MGIELYKISDESLNLIISKVNNLSSEVIIWLRENRDFLLQEDIDKILSINQVSNTKIINILMSYRKILTDKDGKLAIIMEKSLTNR